MADLLVIGRKPPPIGGVTMHVERLTGQLLDNGLSFEFLESSRGDLLGIWAALAGAKGVHIHVSNSYLRLILIWLARIGKCKVIFTLHGNLGRFGGFRNWVDRVCIRFADAPIMLNRSSLNQALEINEASTMISAFLMPGETDVGDPRVAAMVGALKVRCQFLFCTNAYARSLDKHGRDIYGIEDLLNVFEARPNFGLVISDPSGTYSQHFLERGIGVPGNVSIISWPHCFIEVIRQADCMIRATTTDGDSISVKEALSLGVNVIASDCVPRPFQCTLYKGDDREDLANAIDRFAPTPVDGGVEDGFPALLGLYKELGVISQRGGSLSSA